MKGFTLSMKARYLLFLLFLVSFMVSSCTGQKPAVVPTVTGQPSNGYPAPQAAQNEAYPQPEAIVPPAQSLDSSYPNPVVPTVDLGAPITIVPFNINKPVLPGATEVLGNGPAGVPIILVDITMNGEIMALTTIKEDGTFVFQVPGIAEGRWLGISIGDLSATEWTESSFNFDGFLGSEARSIPNIGLFFDTVYVISP